MSWTIYGPHGPEGPQGPKGLNWQNAGWVTATDYVVDDALTHNGTAYRATSAHTSGAATEPGVGGSWTTVWAVVAAGAGDLDDLTDVDLTTTPPADGDGLFFDTVSGLWLPSAPAAGGGGLTRIEYWKVDTSPGTAVIWTNQPAAVTAFPSSSFFGAFPQVVDLSGVTEARLIVHRGGNVPAVNAKLAVQYGDASGDEGIANAWDSPPSWQYLDGASGPVVGIYEWNAPHVSPWATLDAAAQIEMAYIRVVGLDGDGTADPNFYSVFIELR